MTDIPNEVAKKVLDKVIDRALKEAGYMCCLRDNAADNKKQKGKLEAKLKAVKQHCDATTSNAQDAPNDVVNWIEEADKAIQEDTKIEKTWYLRWGPFWQRYSKGKALSKNTEAITGLLQEAETLKTEGVPSDHPGVKRFPLNSYLSLNGRKLKCEELLNALKNDNNCITVLQGMGGIGKTTLAIEVGQELEQLEEFKKVVVTTVSSTPDIRKIQDDIAAQLKLELKDKTESQRQGLLWNRLTNGEKILLILDDVWENTVKHVEFDKIGIPGRGQHKGCRVLLTTREVSVFNSMGCDRIINLDLLSDEDAWTLFQKFAGLSDSSTPSLRDKGHQIARECGKLPLAIEVVAKRLKGQEQRQEKWDHVLTSLKNAMPVHGADQSLNVVYKCLRYSYDNLEKEEAKKLFLLCSLFPEDKELPAEILTRYGIGAGLFGEVFNKYNVARLKVADAKYDLIDSSLLLEAEKGRVKMHDLVREVALLMANKEIRAMNLSDKHQMSLVKMEKSMKYLLLEGNDKDVFSYRFDDSELEILKVSCMVEGGSMAMLKSFFENMKKLRVLHLSSQDWRRTSLSLPQSIESLTNIRSLILERLRLGDISILGKLQSLEALDLVRCEVVELPREIAELKRLRLLKLDHCEIGGNNAFEVIERCSSLEELYFIKFKVHSSAIHKKITLPPALQRYHIRDQYRYGFGIEAYDSISKFVSILNIDTYFSETTFKDLVQTAEALELEGFKGEWRNLIPDTVPIDHLVKLCLKSCSKLQFLIDSRRITPEQNITSKLNVLELTEMKNLEELCNGPLPSDFLKSLETLSIKSCKVLRSRLFKSKLNVSNLKTITLRDCPKLVTLFPLLTSQSLMQLEELGIHDCEQLENIIEDERTGEELGDKTVDGDNDNKGKSPGSMFPKLKTLYIERCPLLEFILPVLSARDVPVLESVTIGYIFGKYQHENEELDLHQEVKDVVLASLQKMLLTSLPSFIDIFAKSYRPECSSRKSLSSKSQMQSEPMKCNIFTLTHKYRHKLRSSTSAQIPLHRFSASSASNSYHLQLWEGAQCLSKQFQILRNMKEIQLWNLPRIESVFILSIAPTMVLETLIVQHCRKLKHIIIDNGDDSGGKDWGNVFPKLRKLSVSFCRKLEYIFGQYPDDHQNHNEIHLHLPALKYLYLFNLPNLIGISPKNYRTSSPPLTGFELNECSQLTIKCIGDLMVQMDSRQQDATTTKV
ncbi:probable disease resistance protein At1g61300 [Gastrolobium bilobum]|uniref:probable disease resistance protein At1g61300 n=1 Tax=Gastrolobium bilobum TaxID=150636 RepID=UPI002AB18AD6|nr:probable disease resistance protein At1g61300 [Gastrolobium bilobum]